MRHRFTAGLLAATFAAGLFAIGGPRADASSKGRKNTVLELLQYQNGYSAPYTTDTSGCRHYYDPRYGDGYQQYGYQPYGYHRGGYYRTAAYQGESYPSGWRHGEKRGWRGHSVPPGHWRHGER